MFFLVYLPICIDMMPLTPTLFYYQLNSAVLSINLFSGQSIKMVEAIKTDDMPAVAEETVKPENTTTDATLKEMKIIRQVEYYFGNVNLWRDKFLKEKVKEDDGWVTLECLITFNRLQSLSVDFDEIATALAKSKTGLLEIHEDKLKIRRSTSNPLPDPEDPVLRKASKMKTLYMKGFPKTHQLDDVQDFILSQGCQNIFIKMKLDEEKNFKGSVIVELATMEEVAHLCVCVCVCV